MYIRIEYLKFGGKKGRCGGSPLSNFICPPKMGTKISFQNIQDSLNRRWLDHQNKLCFGVKLLRLIICFFK